MPNWFISGCLKAKNLLIRPVLKDGLMEEQFLKMVCPFVGYTQDADTNVDDFQIKRRFVDLMINKTLMAPGNIRFINVSDQTLRDRTDK